jgi:hypothetical protein
MLDCFFWDEPTKWPHDSSSHVFLARALNRIGKANFGEEWTGTEHLMTALGASDHDGLAELRRARLEGMSGGYQRRRKVEAKIVAACQSGALESAYRHHLGGEFTPIPSIWWNTENASQRFEMCQIHPEHPYAQGFAGFGLGFCWIFISSESLERFLVQLPNSEERAGFDFHLSPYMAVMHAVARKMGITPDNQPTKEEIMAELRNAWKAPVKLSENMEKAMATLLREVESQGGRANKRSTKKTALNRQRVEPM